LTRERVCTCLPIRVPLLRKGVVQSFNAATLLTWKKGRKEGKRPKGTMEE